MPDGGMREEIESWLEGDNLIYLATVEGDQPKVRPVSLIRSEDGYYVITGARGGRNAGKVRQIESNPRVEYYLTLADGEKRGFIRGECNASIVEDPSIKARLHGQVVWAKSYFESPSQPDYVLLRLIHRTYSYRKPGEFEIKHLEL